jgi:hypothetical protein
MPRCITRTKTKKKKGSKTGSAAMPKAQTISLISKETRRITFTQTITSEPEVYEVGYG